MNHYDRLLRTSSRTLADSAWPCQRHADAREAFLLVHSIYTQWKRFNEYIRMTFTDCTQGCCPLAGMTQMAHEVANRSKLQAYHIRRLAWSKKHVLVEHHSFHGLATIASCSFAVASTLDYLPRHLDFASVAQPILDFSSSSFAS